MDRNALLNLFSSPKCMENSKVTLIVILIPVKVFSVKSHSWVKISPEHMLWLKLLLSLKIWQIQRRVSPKIQNMKKSHPRFRI